MDILVTRVTVTTLRWSSSSAPLLPSPPVLWSSSRSRCHTLRMRALVRLEALLFPREAREKKTVKLAGQPSLCSSQPQIHRYSPFPPTLSLSYTHARARERCTAIRELRSPPRGNMSVSLPHSVCVSYTFRCNIVHLLLSLILSPAL